MSAHERYGWSEQELKGLVDLTREEYAECVVVSDVAIRRHIRGMLPEVAEGLCKLLDAMDGDQLLLTFGIYALQPTEEYRARFRRLH